MQISVSVRLLPGEVPGSCLDQEKCLEMREKQCHGIVGEYFRSTKWQKMGKGKDFLKCHFRAALVAYEITQARGQTEL